MQKGVKVETAVEETPEPAEEAVIRVKPEKVA